MSQEPERWPEWLTALTLTWLVSAGLLLLGSQLPTLLGTKGPVAVERLMGIVWVAVTMQMLLDGNQEPFQLPARTK